MDRRVVLHEFGHALLWDNIHSANFGFAHSAGDSLAAILSDPESKVPDRFQTFPWIPAISTSRRHDRKVSDWAWGSKVVLDENGRLISGDDGSYGSEQILSTTLFRIYQSLGGDSNSGSIKKFASRYVTYLIIRAIGSLASDPITRTDTPDIFATALMNADITTANFEGNHGGFLHKVIRWSFEKQGLYQLPDAPRPVKTEGAPPEVDVFIDDGRNGEYSYQSNFWNSPAIWNRISPDGGTIHQPPSLGSQNYVYVRVNNRGTQAANSIVIKGYHSIVSAGLVFPDDWQPMTTPQISLSETVAPGAEIIAGPFKWTPDSDGEENLLMTVRADGDPSNADLVDWSIPNWLLVPFDNNIAQKNLGVFPVGS